VFLGASFAVASHAAIDLRLVALVLIGALLAHISVNMLNEYEDFVSGLDLATVRTPFSGGSGALPAQPAAARQARRWGLLALVGTLLIGLLLLYERGPGLLPPGLLGILLVGVYSTHIVRWPLASLVSAGLGFGPLMVTGTAFVLSGSYLATAVAASLVPFFLVSDLLLLNQFPDVEADRAVGRRNVPIVLGRRASSLVYGAFLAGAYGSIAAGLAWGILPSAAAVALLPGLAAPLLALRVRRNADDRERLVPLLGWNVALTLITIVLLGVGIAVG